MTTFGVGVNFPVVQGVAEAQLEWGVGIVGSGSTVLQLKFLYVHIYWICGHIFKQL